MTNVKKTTLTTMYKIKNTFALMLVSVVLFKIVEMKNHINVNIRNRPKDLELHGHKRCLIFQRSLWSCFLRFWKENTSKTNPVYWRFWCFNINVNISDGLKCTWQACCLLYCIIPDKASDPLRERFTMINQSCYKHGQLKQCNAKTPSSVVFCSCFTPNNKKWIYGFATLLILFFFRKVGVHFGGFSNSLF